MAGFASRRAEDYIRRHMGMPPRPGSREEKRQRRQTERSARADRSEGYGYAGSRERAYGSHDDGSVIPREYAEDVEFTEYKDFSEETEVTGTESGMGRFRRRHKTEEIPVENQVSDAEWEEINVRK